MIRPFLALGVMVTLGLGCAALLKPGPDYHPPQDCIKGRIGRMMRAPNQINESLQDCYVCELATRCTDEGNHYCCADRMCSECHDSPVNFGAKHPDAGVVDGGGK